MTPSALRAKASSLVNVLYNAANNEGYCGTFQASEASSNARRDLTAFVEALIECAGALPTIAEWADAGRHEEDFSAIAKKAKSALSRLEELTK